MNTGLIGIVTVKDFEKSKKRLARRVGLRERAELVRAMFEDVVEELSKIVDRVIIVTPSTRIGEYYSKWSKCDVLLDEGVGRVEAIRKAIDYIEKTYPSAESIIITVADIPCASSKDFQEIVSLAEKYVKAIVLSPARDWGTNIILLKPPNVIKPVFGVGSFWVNLAKAIERDIAVRVYSKNTVRVDLDYPEDLEEALRIGCNPRTRLVLMRILGKINNNETT